jgi:hypothetical protein
MEHDLPLVGLETIALVPVQAVKAQSQSEQGQAKEGWRPPTNDFLHGITPP